MVTETVHALSSTPAEMCCSTFAPRAAVGVSSGAVGGCARRWCCGPRVLVGWSPLVEDGGVGVGGAESEDGAVAHRGDAGGQLGGALVVG